MSEKSGRDLVSTSAWWCACSYEDAIRYFHKEEFFEVVEASLIDDLSKELVGRLCSVLLEGGHVDIIDKEDHFFASKGSDFGSSFFGELVFV
jgi:hypothetical protein